MLLTKPLTTFLNANRTPQIHTLLLVTPTGKLLSSSSPLPASTLRAQATLASSLWSLYDPIFAGGTASAALPPPPSHHDADDHSYAAFVSRPRDPDPDLSNILIQLDNGIMSIRALRCALLFVVIGPAPPSSSSSTSLPSLTQDLSYLSVASAASPPTSPHSYINGEGGERRANASFTNLHGLASGATSVTGSLAGTGTGSMKLLKRQAEELAKWLDGELEGFSLSSGF